MAKIFINIPDIHNPDNKIKFSIEYSDDDDIKEEDPINPDNPLSLDRPDHPMDPLESFELFLILYRSNPENLKRKVSDYNVFVKYHLILMKNRNIRQQEKIKEIGELWQLKKEIDENRRKRERSSGE